MASTLGAKASAHGAYNHGDAVFVEDDATLLFDAKAIAVVRITRLWLNIDANPQEYLVWEEVMERWSEPRASSYGSVGHFSSAHDRFDKDVSRWWRQLQLERHTQDKGYCFSRTGLKRLLRRRFVPPDKVEDTKNISSPDQKEDKAPASGLNIQFNKVKGDDGDKGRGKVGVCFKIKGLACKLISDGGNFINVHG